MHLTLSQILLTGLLASSAIASPLRKRESDVVQGRLGSDAYWNDYDGGINTYTMYNGNGSVAAGWPDELSWVSFNNLWVTSRSTIARSCDTLYKVPNMSDQEIQDLYDSIKVVAHETRVDHRFILAAIIQETKGCVRAKTSVSPDGTVVNPGLLQSFRGTHSCNDQKGKVTTPCPRDTIEGMVRDGVGGTGSGHGFAVDINDQGKVADIGFAEAYYRAARLYNSGAIDPSGDLGKGSATHCYATDIANRLVGWTGAETSCTLDDGKN